MTTDCPLCGIASGRTPAPNLLFEDDLLCVMLSEDRAVRGHAVLVWKAHVENVSDLAEEDATHLMRIFRAAEAAILGAAGKERAILLKLGLQVPHLHLHIYPFSGSDDRRTVFDAFDTKTRDDVSDEEHEWFLAEVRERMATGTTPKVSNP